MCPAFALVTLRVCLGQRERRGCEGEDEELELSEG